LLYVTLTRAVYACYLGMPASKKGNRNKPPKPCPEKLDNTAVGRLLNQGVPISTSDAVKALIQSWLDACSDIQVVEPSVSEETLFVPVQTTQPVAVCSDFSGEIERNWWVTSYSRLSSVHARHDAAFDASAEIKGYAEPKHSISEYDSSGFDTSERNIHTFPRGAEQGSFLHTLFENINYQQVDSQETLHKIDELFRKNPFANRLALEALPSYKWSRLSEEDQLKIREADIMTWCNILHQMMMSVLTTPLQQDNVTDTALSERLPILKNTVSEQRLVELSFYA